MTNEQQKSYFGKYRGVVTDDNDPLRMGRVKVRVPAVFGDTIVTWAMPCVPYAGSKIGLWAIPPIKALVWVEFEGGDVEYPIWTGCFWQQGETPPGCGDASVIALCTEEASVRLSRGKNAALQIELKGGASGPVTLTLDGKAIKLALENTKVTLTARDLVIEQPPAKIAMSNGSVELKHSSASIKLEGARVSVNGNALEVT